MKTIQILLLTFCFAAQAYAADENLKVTTYYPSPEGEYKKLKTTEQTLLATDSSATNPAARVGIGTVTPSPNVKLDVVGKIRIADGTQAADYVLTSNASGEARWQAPSGGGKPVITRYTSFPASSFTKPEFKTFDVYGMGSGSNLGSHDACSVSGFHVQATPLGGGGTTFMTDQCSALKKTDGTWVVSYTYTCDVICLKWSSP